MHRCFEVLEILNHILDFVLQSEGGQKSLAALAISCRTFQDPALDVLWRRLPCIGPLVRCLPSDAWEVKPEAADGLGWDEPSLVRPHFASASTDLIKSNVYRFSVVRLRRRIASLQGHMRLASGSWDTKMQIMLIHGLQEALILFLPYIVQSIPLLSKHSGI